MPVPGPARLGRGVVVRAGTCPPSPWAGAPVVTIDEAVLADPGPAVTALHEAWANRRPVVVALAVDPARFRAPQGWDAEPWTFDARFEPSFDRLHFLVWANTYDARGGGQHEPVWWWARKAERLGARSTPAGPADVVLPDGRPAWVDGGPRAPLDPAELGAAVVHRESVELERLVPAPPPCAPTADLAPDQLAAVAHASGPARVVAPAGSGKTRVLTERLRHLVVDRRVEREAVLAVAYNKKAQTELETRCSAFRPHVRTLNSLGLSLVTEAQGRAPRVLEEREVRRVVETIVESVARLQRRANTDPLAPYLEALTAIRLGLRDPEEVEADRDDVPGLAATFARYRKELAAAGAVDFDEQVYGALEVLLADGAFRRRAQLGCRHLLVDEFQDLTPAHVLLLRLLAVPGLDVFGVGDDDQVIYGYAGADPGFLIDFGSLFPAAASHPLEVNYRCPAAVVSAARALLSYNFRRVDKEIRPGPAADPDPGALTVRRHPPDAGAEVLVEVVQGWLVEPGVRPSDVAVLTRVNSLLLAPHVALAQAGVPLASELRPEVLERTGVRAALAYLRLGCEPESMRGGDVAEVWRRPGRGLPRWFPDRLRRRERWTLGGLRAMAAGLPGKEADKVRLLVDDLETVAEAVRQGTTRHVLSVVKDEVGLGRAMGLLDGSGAGEGSSHLDDLEALAQVADLHPDPSTFETWLRKVFHRETAGDGVQLSTVHRVKGMEWDRVVVFGVTAGVMPHRLADDDEEERRVLHVAVTRGRRRVLVLGDAGRPSAFLDELAGVAPHRRPPPTDATGLGRGEGEPAQRGQAARRPGSEVEARVGLVLEAPGGFAGTVVRLGTDGALVRLDSGANLWVRYGDTVKVRGKALLLVPRPSLGPDAERAEEALRTWRAERCRRDGVPAFVVLHDRHLRALATVRPANLEELARVEGIGPTKLELYGEEILEVLRPAGA